MARRFFPTLSLLVCLWGLSGCAHPHYQPDWDGSGRGVVMLMNRVEESRIQEEKAGVRPPKGNKTWRQYWRERLTIYRGYAVGPGRGQGSSEIQFRQMAEYVTRRRAEEGLPSVD